MNNNVLRSFKFLSLLWLAVFATARLSGHEGSHSYSLPIEDIGKVEPAKAVNLYAQLSSYHPEAKEHFRDALLQRGDIEDFFKRRLEDLPQTPFNGGDRNIYFRILSDLRTPWAARICGQHLLSDYKIVLPEFKTEKEARDFFIEAGATTTTNSIYAMYALEQMNIDTAPTKFGMPTPSGKKSERDLWREWWRKNEANIESLLAGEVAPNSRRAHEEEKIEAPKKPDKRQPVTSNKALNTITEKSAPIPWWLIMSSVAILALAFAVWLKARKSKSTP